MKKIILIIIGVVVLAVLVIFGWGVGHFYRLIKSGQATGPTAQQLPDRTNNDKLIASFSPHLGNPQARVSIVEFGDFDCPQSVAVFPAIRELLAKNSQKIDFVFRFFPAVGDTMASLPALAAACANEQDKFWAYHDKLFQNSAAHSLDDLKKYAQQIGLNVSQFNQCLDSKKLQSQVEEDAQTGLTAGIQGTPTFFINGAKAEGAIPLEAWEKFIDTVK